MVIELRRLRHLLAVAEHANFSRAAEAVHLTQPALTRSIQALEAEVGAPVFERNRGAIEPTEIGRILLRHAGAMLAGTRDLEHDVRLAKGLELGELRIGVGPFGGAALIGPVVGRLSRAHPRLQVKLTVAPWQELPERARAREVDLVVAELSEIRLLEDFAQRELSAHGSRFICRAGHPLTRLARPRAQDLFAYPLAGPRLPPHAVRALIAAMPANLRQAAVRNGPLAIECDSSAVLENIVMASDAVSNMPRFIAERELSNGLLVALPGLDIGVRVQFGAAWIARRTLGGAAAKFVELLAEHDRALAQPRSAAAERARKPR
jgi:DNA-binding transcriptional LysR family regulator